MKFFSKKGRNQLVSLYIGLSGIIGGLMLLYFRLSNYQTDWSIYYIPFHISGALTAYLWMTRPGKANKYVQIIGKRVYSSSEKFYSKSLALIVTIFITLVILLAGVGNYQFTTFDIWGFPAEALNTFLITFPFLLGIKFLSGFINITRDS